MGYKGLNSPIRGSGKRPKNPTTKKSMGQLKKDHSKQLAQSGLREPKSPI